MSDRFLIALILAGFVHGFIILGIAFDVPRPEQIKKSLSVTLVQAPTKEAPKKAEFLAQDNQIGSGNTQTKVAPKAPPPIPLGRTRVAEPEEEERPTPPPRPQPPPKPVIRQERPAKKIPIADTEPTEEPDPEPAPKEKPKFSASQLSEQIAQVSAELSQHVDTKAHGPRTAYINSVNAYKYKAAAYQSYWQQKIEQIGNLNYPEEARRRKLSGRLVLAVGIRHDGSVDSIHVRQSSGYAVLDDAAVRIVKLAAPFSPFPEELRRDQDVLVITRTWRFYDGHRLETTQ